MRVEHVIPSLAREDSGPTQSVGRLCESLGQEGVDVGLISAGLGASLANTRIALYPSIALHAHAFSPSMALPISRALATADIVHNHGLWAFPNVLVGLSKQRTGARLVTSPRGTLSPNALQFSRWKKRLFRPLQWPVLSRAECLHATSESECIDIRAAGLSAPIALIPNGIDIPPQPTAPRSSDRRLLLYLGRLHPIKGIELLLEAWASVQARYPEWELVIAGEGERGYEYALGQRVRALGAHDVSFIGPVYGEQKRALYGSASLFVLPTRSENFGMAVAEALASGIPVITTHGAPWEGLRRHGCGFWVERTFSELGGALSSALSMSPSELRTMGARGRDWMLRDFHWPVVASRLLAVYRWLIQGGAPPGDVRL